MPDLSLLEHELGLSFKDSRLIKQALVHSSYHNENPGLDLGSNERLEFLGDAFIDLVVGHELYRRHTDLPEGQLTQLRSALVNGETLARVAESLRLGEFLLMGRGEEQSGGRDRPSNLAGTLEALVGALFLDQGYDAAGEFIIRVLKEEMDNLSPQKAPKDPKTLLQEAFQEQGLPSPRYEIVGVAGPEHDRRFTVEVLMDGKVMGRGMGHRKSEGEQRAAQQALEALGYIDK